MQFRLNSTKFVNPFANVRVEIFPCQACFVKTGQRISSSCSGAYTGEMAAALACKVVNDSRFVTWKIFLQSVSCHDP